LTFSSFVSEIYRSDVYLRQMPDSPFMIGVFPNPAT